MVPLSEAAELCCRDPIVLPFYHSGMGEVMPEHGRILRVGKQVNITVGDRVDLSDLTCRCKERGKQQQQARLHFHLRCICGYFIACYPPDVHSHLGLSLHLPCNELCSGIGVGCEAMDPGVMKAESMISRWVPNRRGGTSQSASAALSKTWKLRLRQISNRGITQGGDLPGSLTRTLQR